MSDVKYWIWLSMALGAGARTDEVLSVYPEPEDLYKAGRMDRIISGVFTKNKLDKLEAVTLEAAENAISICRKNGWKIYTPQSSEYPESLKNLIDMPLVLFCDGDITCLEGKLAIGIVGTRNPSYDSAKIARKLASEISEKGAVVVSGGALGIDSAAHEGALSAGAPTVCVLGCGLGTRYLVSNDAMRREIAKNGAVVTEYPPFAPASRTTFPLRNRIISGLSEGVLVVEAGEKSGSLITANCALEQGKEVFAVPGSILDTSHTGVNKLIKDGAMVVTSSEDIIYAYSSLYPYLTDTKAPEDKPKSDAAPTDLAGDALTVYKLLGREPLHSDEICAMSGLTPPKVMAALTELELFGYAEQTEGKSYVRV